MLVFKFSGVHFIFESDSRVLVHGEYFVGIGAECGMFLSPYFEQIEYIFGLLSFLKVIEATQMSFVEGLIDKAKFFDDECF